MLNIISCDGLCSCYAYALTLRLRLRSGRQLPLINMGAKLRDLSNGINMLSFNGLSLGDKM